MYNNLQYSFIFLSPSAGRRPRQLRHEKSGSNPETGSKFRFDTYIILDRTPVSSLACLPR